MLVQFEPPAKNILLPLGCHFYRLLLPTHRLFEIAHLRVGCGKRFQHEGVIFSHLASGTLGVLERPLPVANVIFRKGGPQPGKIIVGLDVVRLDPQGFPVVRDRFVSASQVIEGTPQIVVGRGIFRF